jgi:phosphonate transport system permease protein
LDLQLSTLLSAKSRAAAWALVASMWPPSMDPALWRSVGPAVGETLAISILGTLLAAGAGLLLAIHGAHDLVVGEAGARGPFGSTRRLGPQLRYGLARGLMNLGRTLPEVVWAFIFIFAVGLGPFAGALALGVHNAGVLGRLYAEVLDEIPRGSFQAARAAGASRTHAIVFVLLPAAAPQLLSYTLYRWEVSVRASTVLGIVGAGGIGTKLYVALSLFQHHEALTLLLAVLALVTAADQVSHVLRLRIMGSAELSARRPEIFVSSEPSTPRYAKHHS